MRTCASASPCKRNAGQRKNVFELETPNQCQYHESPHSKILPPQVPKWEMCGRTTVSLQPCAPLNFSLFPHLRRQNFSYHRAKPCGSLFRKPQVLVAQMDRALVS